MTARRIDAVQPEGDLTIAVLEVDGAALCRCTRFSTIIPGNDWPSGGVLTMFDPCFRGPAAGGGGNKCAFP
jgi:hypothetical protein